MCLLFEKSEQTGPGRLERHVMCPMYFRRLNEVEKKKSGEMSKSVSCALVVSDPGGDEAERGERRVRCSGQKLDEFGVFLIPTSRPVPYGSPVWLIRGEKCGLEGRVY